MYMMRRNRRSSAARAFGVVAAAVVVGGCATKSDIRALQTEVREELRAQAVRQDSLLAMLRRDAASTQDTLRTQTDQLFDFRGDITRLLQSLTQGQARLEALVGETQRGMAALRNQGGNTSRGPGPTAGPGVLQDTTTVRPSRGEAVTGVGGNADQLYGAARDQHQRGSLSSAQEAYEQFLRDFSSDPRAADAQWYLADLLTQQNRPDDALEAFQQIPARHPMAPRVPDALFRIAGLQADLGNTADARATLQRIVNTYPDAGVASLARIMLEEIR